jgi:hypothetical protein
MSPVRATKDEIVVSASEDELRSGKLVKRPRYEWILLCGTL